MPNDSDRYFIRGALYHFENAISATKYEIGNGADAELKKFAEDMKKSSQEGLAFCHGWLAKNVVEKAVAKSDTVVAPMSREALVGYVNDQVAKLAGETGEAAAARLASLKKNLEKAVETKGDVIDVEVFGVAVIATVDPITKAVEAVEKAKPVAPALAAQTPSPAVAPAPVEKAVASEWPKDLAAPETK